MILTDANGRPFARPKREDYPNLIDYIRAFHAYKDTITNCANEAFAKGYKP